MNLTVTSSPHIRGDFRTSRLMLDVVLALVPALIVGAVVLGVVGAGFARQPANRHTVRTSTRKSAKNFFMVLPPGIFESVRLQKTQTVVFKASISDCSVLTQSNNG